MYLPDHYRVDDLGAIHALMRARPFATIVTQGQSGLEASHVPTLLKADEGEHGVIEMHLARANLQWKQAQAGHEALVIFGGPEAYIRPVWYPTKQETGKVVPTWNYAVVHAHGRAEAMPSKEWLARHVAELSASLEERYAAPWSTDDAPESFIDVMVRGIVGLRFEISRLEGKLKLNQNKTENDQIGTIDGLRQRAEGGDLEIAELMTNGRDTSLDG